MKRNFVKSLIAVLAGTFLYFFVLEERLPPAAQHEAYRIDLGLVVAFWLCLVFYGVVDAVERRRRKKSVRDAGRIP